MALRGRFASAKKSSSYSCPLLVPPCRLPSPSSYPFGLLVGCTPWSGSSSIHVLLLPPASSLASDNNPSTKDFFSFAKSFSSSAPFSDVLCRRLSRQAQLAKDHLPGGCVITGPWFRVSERLVDEFVERFEDNIPVSSLVSAFNPLLSSLDSAASADRPFPLSVVVFPCDDVTGSISPSGTFVLLRFRTSAPPSLVGSELLRPPSSPFCSCACLLPLQIDISFSPSNLLAEASVCPDVLTNLLAAELCRAFEDIFSGPVWSVEAAGANEPILLSNPSSPLSTCLPSAPLVYLQPLLSRVTPLHFLLSTCGCERLSFTASFTDLPSFCHPAPTASLSLRDNFVSAAVAPYSTPLSSVTRFLSVDAATSLAGRLVQIILDGPWAEEGPEKPPKDVPKNSAVRFLPSRCFLWSFGASEEGCAAQERKRPGEKLYPRTTVQTVPLSYIMQSEGGASKSKYVRKDDVVMSARETLDFLLGISDPRREGELEDSYSPQVLQRSVLSSKRDTQDTTMRGRSTLRERNFWDGLTRTLQMKNTSGRRGPTRRRRGYSPILLWASLGVLFAVLLWYIVPQFASKPQLLFR
ncbi:transmembrane protein [Cystoisospora suis]|uniref:Transmembrane protein n=1 Tax=Cystoisospora suis TaxID=483139 RepID=A0A2C6LAM8_9APIC|nr:transmembrane protein [Cystoisospora suis]